MASLIYKLLALLLTTLLAILAAFSAGGGAVDWFVYDRAASAWLNIAPNPATAPPPVLIGIDEDSLAQLGIWPWPRQLHADLIERLNAAGAAAIGYNIAFIGADTQQPEDDQALVRAITASRKVISPVFATRNGMEIRPFYAEQLTYPALGHVHIEVDDDTLARRVFLYAGVGQPRWPIMGLAVWQRALDDLGALPGRRSPVSDIDFENHWSQDYEVLVPFMAGADDLERYSFAEVLGGQVPASAFRDRAVFIGLTAAGFEQRFRVYVAGQRTSLSGTEIQARIYHALQRGGVITVLPVGWSLALAAAAGLWLFAVLWIFRCKATTQRNWVMAVALSLFAIPVIALHNAVWLNITPALAVLTALLCFWGVWQVKLLDTSARRDPMTALANRRMFDAIMADEWMIAGKKRTPISLLLVDVDYFKQFNDHFGHAHGDWALIQVADLLPKYSRRARDLAARYGGEEFAVILPETDLQHAEQLAQSLCGELRALGIEHPGSAPYGVLTLSIGVACTIPNPGERLDDFIHKTDLALYQAKSDGRNCVRLAD